MEEHPTISPQNVTPRPLRRGIGEIRRTKAEINQLLMADSPEYAALLAKESKTDEEITRITKLRDRLISQNEKAQDLRRRAEIIKRRLHDRLRRNRPARPVIDTLRPSSDTNSPKPDADE